MVLNISVIAEVSSMFCLRFNDNVKFLRISLIFLLTPCRVFSPVMGLKMSLLEKLRFQPYHFLVVCLYSDYLYYFQPNFLGRNYFFKL